jgi:hypothetical protein
MTIARKYGWTLAMYKEDRGVPLSHVILGYAEDPISSRAAVSSSLCTWITTSGRQDSGQHAQDAHSDTH